MTVSQSAIPVPMSPNGSIDNGASIFQFDVKTRKNQSMNIQDKLNNRLIIRNRQVLQKTKLVHGSTTKSN